MGKKAKIDSYFLSERCPFSNRRKPNWKAIKLASGLGLGALVLALLMFGPEPPKHSASVEMPEAAVASVPVSEAESRYLQQEASSGYRVSGRGGTARNRQFSASQIVARTGARGDQLPVGSTLLARLVNSVLTTDKNSPVIAEIPEDIIWKNQVVIPAGTRAVGQASLDDATRRLQARFHMLVFPQGDQHSVSALALMSDGSSGIAGDYHSRTLEKQGGRFLGNFIGGLAEGMKDRSSTGGQFSITMEPGSLKNGLLNGLAASSFDQAKSYADSTQDLAPYLGVPAGAPFLLYLEKEFGP